MSEIHHYKRKDATFKNSGFRFAANLISGMTPFQYWRNECLQTRAGNFATRSDPFAESEDEMQLVYIKENGSCEVFAEFTIDMFGMLNVCNPFYKKYKCDEFGITNLIYDLMALKA